MNKKNPKILITGGSGALGSCIKRLIKCDAPDRDELNVVDFKKCLSAIKKYNPDIVIHCAAWTDVAGAETNKKGCWQTNVEGTENMIKAAAGRRFVYISTHYVFDGDKGNYKENDIPNPINFYSLTKLVGEAIIKQYDNTLVIRTGFKKDGPWQYKNAFADQWTCADFASERAPDIIRASCMIDLRGTIHISGKKKTIYDLAKKVSPNIGKIYIRDAKVKLPRLIYLNSSLWKKILSKLRTAKK